MTHAYVGLQPSAYLELVQASNAANMTPKEALALGVRLALTSLIEQGDAAPIVVDFRVHEPDGAVAAHLGQEGLSALLSLWRVAMGEVDEAFSQWCVCDRGEPDTWREQTVLDYMQAVLPVVVRDVRFLNEQRTETKS